MYTGQVPSKLICVAPEIINKCPLEKNLKSSPSYHLYDPEVMDAKQVALFVFLAACHVPIQAGNATDLGSMR